jgi:DNA-binding MarR family transcriptional regulator
MKLFKNSMAHIVPPIQLIAMEGDMIFNAILKKEFGLTLPILQTLIPVELLGACTQNDIARFKGVSEAAVSKHVAVLIEKKLIKRVADTTDARKSNLTLTLRGKAFVLRAQLRIIGEMESIYGDITPEERALVGPILERMLRLIISRSPRKELFEKSKNPMVRKMLKQIT